MPNNWLIYRTKISLKKRHQSHQIYYVVNIFIHQWKIWFQFYHVIRLKNNGGGAITCKNVQLFPTNINTSSSKISHKILKKNPWRSSHLANFLLNKLPTTFIKNRILYRYFPGHYPYFSKVALLGGPKYDYLRIYRIVLL